MDRKEFFYWDYDLLFDIQNKLKVNQEVLKNNVRELSKILNEKDLEKIRRNPHAL